MNQLPIGPSYGDFSGENYETQLVALARPGASSNFGIVLQGYTFDLSDTQTANLVLKRAYVRDASGIVANTVGGSNSNIRDDLRALALGIGWSGEVLIVPKGPEPSAPGRGGDDPFGPGPGDSSGDEGPGMKTVFVCKQIPYRSALDDVQFVVHHSTHHAISPLTPRYYSDLVDVTHTVTYTREYLIAGLVTSSYFVLHNYYVDTKRWVPGMPLLDEHFTSGSSQISVANVPGFSEVVTHALIVTR